MRVARLGFTLDRMKVTVQNGAIHGLSRRDVEAIVPLLPGSWSGRVRQIVLYQGDSPDLKLTFYPKAQIIGLFWPVPKEAASKADGLRELLLALSVVAERGELPKRLSNPVRTRHLESLGELMQTCLSQVAANAV